MQKHFGIEVTPGLITVPGRVLEGPKVNYMSRGGGNKQVSLFARDGSWNMREIKFNKSGRSLNKWAWLMISFKGQSRGEERDNIEAASVKEAVGGFVAELRKVGVVAAEPTSAFQSIKDDEDVELDNRIKDLKAKGMQLVLIVMPDYHMALYKRIKFYGDVKHGVHTVCVVRQKFTKQQTQYFANVALKFNLKLGGSNQLVEDARMGILKGGKTMVVGIDVTHPSPGSASNAPSVAGMVASKDSQLAQWPAILRIQKAGQETVTDLTAMLESRLELWHKANKAYPENILVYRDGVSEGQYQMVLNDEVPRLRKACQQKYSPEAQKRGLPRLTVVVVGKRHHTRFYATKSDDSTANFNTKAGTVVDRGVTEVRNWDFFLQSHHALQGTARPAHYFIVLDEIFRDHYKRGGLPSSCQNVADVLERLTQSLCYVFGRATKAVSVCTPAYYADIVCERARCYLSHVFDPPTPMGSTAGSTTSKSTDVKAADVTINEALANDMFYI